jgi:tRNA pseudouridine38-40 synthase
MYRYRIWNTEILSPFERGRAWHVPSPVLGVSAMDTAARLFEGRHDFSTFQAAGSDVQTAEREVLSSRVVREDPVVLFEITGNGFLRHMVRSIVGTLVEVGRGQRSIASVSEGLASCDRGQAGPTAPAEGLFLVCVEYE